MTPVMVTFPPDSVAPPMPLFTKVGGFARSETSPVIVPVDVEVTDAFAVTAVPCGTVTRDVPPFTVRLVVVAWMLPTASGHCVARLVTFTELSAVDKSYPIAVVHAGIVGEARLTRTPFVPDVVLLQLGEVPAQGTELFPLVTSLKAHVEPVRASVEELQLWPEVAAILYNTGLALPWRPLF